MKLARRRTDVATVSFPRSVVLALCAQYGPEMRGMQPSGTVPAGLIGKYVMAAVATNESSLGADCTPRYEPAWDVDGIYARTSLEQQALLQEFGKDAAYSYGVWQLMYYNCPGYTPSQLVTDAEAGAKCFLNYFNTYVQRKGAVTLEQIGEVYNSGHVWEVTPPPDIQQYVEKLQVNYQMVQTLF